MLSRRAVVTLIATSPLAAMAGTEAVPPTTVKIRTPEQVAYRSLALLAVVRHALAHPGVSAWVKAHQVTAYLSRSEAAFLKRFKPPRQERIAFSWRSEALVPLLWALHQIEKMPPPNTQVHIAGVVNSSGIWSSPATFVMSAKLRSRDALLDARQDALEANWRARDARIHGRPTPPDLDAGIIQERHHGLNWLAGDSGDDWDSISTDT